MLFPQRTRTCGELTLALTETEVVLNGWVHRIRHQGGVAFLTLRDRYGTTQVVVDERSPAGLLDQAAGFKNEYCLAVTGAVKARPETMRNPKMATGDVEVVATEFQVLSTAPALPFPIEEREPGHVAQTPPLIKGYLRSGAWVCGQPAWDPDFHSADFFMMLPLAKLDSRYARHYLKEARTA